MMGEYNKAIALIDELDAITYKHAMKSLCILSDSLKCKLYLLTNKEDKLKTLFEKNINADKNYAFERIIYDIDRARYQIAQGKILEAIDLLQKIAEELKAEKAYGTLTEVELLQARAHWLILEEDKAIDYLLQAVLRTQSAGLIRMYINEGDEIETLLKKIKQKVSTKASPQFKKVDIEYINRLLRVFEKEKKVSAITLDDVLSSRELDTLKLIAENLTNQEIAEALYISITTVKTHVRNILLKLEAKNRREAVLIAKEKGLLR
jgi:LuxR family maltose regulon positive regulatory protein